MNFLEMDPNCYFSCMYPRKKSHETQSHDNFQLGFTFHGRYRNERKMHAATFHYAYGIFYGKHDQQLDSPCLCFHSISLFPSAPIQVTTFPLSLHNLNGVLCP